jgi:uncharacterized protein (TIGR02266 family)
LDNESSGRRTGVRIKARLKVRFKDTSAFISEYTHNISKGGLFVRTAKPCATSSMVEVVLVLPVSGTEITAVGEVIHVVTPEEATEVRPAGMGIELKQIDEKDHKLIEDFIHDNLKSGQGVDGLGRRRHERFETRIRVKFGSLEALMEEYSHNISHGGIFIRTNAPKKLHEKLKIILTHPETGEEMILDGEVVRVVSPEEAGQTSHPVGMGIKFLSLDGYTSDQLSAFINSDHVIKNTRIEVEDV